MAMPPQLARANRRHSRHSEPRPIVELLPNISIGDLCRWKVFPDNWYSHHNLEAQFRYPWARNLIISRKNIEINHVCGYTQRIGIQWARTYFGKGCRPFFVCDQCHCGAYKLYFRHGRVACKWCLKASYASRQCGRNDRKRLQACKLRLKLGGQPDITEPLPPKPKWTRKKTYQRIRSEIQALETKAKKQRFKKPINSQLFAYHVG